MPCRDGGPTEFEIAQSYRDAVDKYARMLCTTIKSLTVIADAEGVDLEIILDPETSAWWKEHQKHDAERIAKEQAAIERQKKIAAMEKDPVIREYLMLKKKKI